MSLTTSAAIEMNFDSLKRTRLLWCSRSGNKFKPAAVFQPVDDSCMWKRESRTCVLFSQSGLGAIRLKFFALHTQGYTCISSRPWCNKVSEEKDDRQSSSRCRNMSLLYPLHNSGIRMKCEKLRFIQLHWVEICRWLVLNAKCALRASRLLWCRPNVWSYVTRNCKDSVARND